VNKSSISIVRTPTSAPYLNALERPSPERIDALLADLRDQIDNLHSVIARQRRHIERLETARA